MMVIMTMVIFILVLDLPLLANCVVWFFGDEVLTSYDFIFDYIKCISSKGIFKAFGSDIVFESLVVEASPFIRNDIFVETFKKWSPRHTNTNQTLVV